MCYVLIVISCKEKSNYNPFDNQFNVSVKNLLKDECDTVFVSCGYINLVNNEDELNPFYQVHYDDFYNVVAKGFEYKIDTFKTIELIENQDSSINLPFDEAKFENEINKYGYSILFRDQEDIIISNFQNNDTIQLKIVTRTDLNKNSVYRNISYFNSNRKNE